MNKGQLVKGLSMASLLAIGVLTVDTSAQAKTPSDKTSSIGVLSTQEKPPVTEPDTVQDTSVDESKEATPTFVKPIFSKDNYYFYYDFEKQATDSTRSTALEEYKLDLANRNLPFRAGSITEMVQKQYTFAITKESETSYNFTAAISVFPSEPVSNLKGSIYGVLINADTKKEIVFDLPFVTGTGDISTAEYFKLPKGNYILQLVDRHKLEKPEDSRVTLIPGITDYIVPSDITILPTSRYYYKGTNIKFGRWSDGGYLKDAVFETKYELYNKETKKYKTVSDYSTNKWFTYKAKTTGAHKFKVSTRIKGTKTVVTSYQTVRIINKVTPTITKFKVSTAKVFEENKKTVKISYATKALFYEGYMKLYKKDKSGKYNLVKQYALDDIYNKEYRTFRLGKGTYKATISIGTDVLATGDTVKKQSVVKTFIVK